MQCCGWDGGSAGSGTLVLGGIDASLYTGELAYTPVVDETYYCVTMTSPPSSDASLCSHGNVRHAAHDGWPRGIGRSTERCIAFV